MVRIRANLGKRPNLLGIGLQKQYCATENNISKFWNKFYEEQAKNNVILKIRNTYLNVFKIKRPLIGYMGKIKLIALQRRTCDEPPDLLTND
jgi:hypothetical protein